MLTYLFKDVNQKEFLLKNPLNSHIIFSEDAPADSLSAVFSVTGKIPVLTSVKVENAGELIFQGIIDEQTETLSQNGMLLEIKARSLAALLLDNEACPQIYYSPSFDLLMKRHFNRLGFHQYIGNDNKHNGELHITKGMSEWKVLKNYCQYFLNTSPVITKDGIINISGNHTQEITYIQNFRRTLISLIHKRKPSVLLSDVYTRTYMAGGYEMYLPVKKAEELEVKRRRYIDSINSSSRTVQSALKILEKSQRNYEEYITESAGCMICEVGSQILIEELNLCLRVKEIIYTLNKNGEKTKIRAEVISKCG